ncbi:expressed unknown protein [Seminavis robusta]|uniref:Uncharacterized protein n=1 Tax=Seminavis robusta TaxID=568900 RepID=A0A9N8E4R9_9STRA|nr:expressed unknown protein [Seminavis robusta]|eukprot:Sro667_g184100.1 n/a (362) ;mRNA; r:2897-4097
MDDRRDAEMNPPLAAAAAEDPARVARNDPAPVPSHTSTLEDSAMDLSPEELRWTEAVKHSALEDTSLKPLSDYEYAAAALVTQGHVETALCSLQGLQDFREEYNIHETVEEGMTLLRQLHIQQPWFVLDVSLELEESRHFVCVYDYAQLNPSAVKMPDQWRVFLGGLYYLYQMIQSDLQAVREGVVNIGECDGMSWSNFSVDMVRTLWHHLMEFYPLKTKEVSWLHASVIGNLQHSLYKSIMGDRAANIRIGVTFEGYEGRLDNIFKVPTEEQALQRLMDRYQLYLTNRYHHQRCYRLPSKVPSLSIDEILAIEAREGGVDEEDEETFSEYEEEEYLVEEEYVALDADSIAFAAEGENKEN